MSGDINLAYVIDHLALTKETSLATIDGARQRTWGELKQRIASIASALNKLGVREGDYLSVISLNSDRYYELFFGAWWSGSAIVPLNNRWSINEILYALNDSKPSVLFFDDSHKDVIEKLRTNTSDLSVQHFIYFGESNCPDFATPYEQLVEYNEPMRRWPGGGDSVAAILYTGGTTGQSKGVMLSHTNLWSNAVIWTPLADFHITGCYLHAAPMFHGADIAMLIGSTLYGSKQVFIPQFDANQVLSAIEKYRVTQTLLVPTMIKRVIEALTVQKSDTSSLRTMIYGASPMPEGLLIDLMEKLPDVGLFQVYGQTETAPVVSVLSKQDHKSGGEKLTSAGQPLSVNDIKIVDSKGEVQSANGIGQIYTCGPNSMLGYLNKPEVTAATLKDGWVATGDVGYIDNDGYLFIMDRAKDMIISGGENIYSAEVESVISVHPAILDVAVIGIPDEQWGESVHAIVRLKPNNILSQDKLINYCKERLSSYKCPKSVAFRDQPFPVSSAGKTLKADLRKPYWKTCSKNVN